jgi:uncharacterized paraquat-inducible protein A
MLRGRTRTPPIMWGLGAVVCFYAVGNVMNRVVFPAIFGDQLELLIQHRQPAMTILEQTLASWCVALVVTLGVATTLRAATTPKPLEPAPRAPAQLVGSSCIVCGARIVMAPEGTACPRCRAPLHERCATSHACDEKL